MYNFVASIWEKTKMIQISTFVNLILVDWLQMYYSLFHLNNLSGESVQQLVAGAGLVLPKCSLRNQLTR